jgi:TonB-linked SusC/RagA family outer membrane protein
MDPYEFVKYQLELNPSGANSRYLIGGRTLESYRDVKSIDFQNLVFNDAPMQNHNLSIRGGGDRTLFSVSANVIDQSGIIVNSGFSRYQGRVSVDQTINSRFKVGINSNYSNSVYFGTIPKSDVSTNASSSYLYSVWGYRPVTTNDDIDLEQDFLDPDVNASSDYRVNPYLSAKNELRRTINNTLIANAYLNYTILPTLTLRVTGGLVNNMIRDEVFNNSLTAKGNPRNILGVNGSIMNAPISNLLNENTLTWKKTLRNAHTFEALAGYTMQFNNSSVSGFSAYNVPNESLGLDGLDQSAAQETVSSSSRWRLQSYLARVNYSYKSRYLFTASARADGSSKFSPGKRWGYFPSASFAWRVSEESFLKNIQAVSNAKFRISYGQTGNNRVSDFPYLSQLTAPISAGYSYNNGSPSLGAVISAFGNPNLKWETTEQTNIGLDLGLFKQRIDLTIDVYRKTTNDLLLNALLPYTTGLSSAYKNVGRMQNQGLEISLNTVNIAREKFKWNTSFNISFNANKVLSLTENQTVLTTPVAFDNKWRALSPYIAVIGQPVSQMYGLIWEGVYGYQDFNRTAAGTYVLKANTANNGNPSADIQPGDIKYRDINGDGTINSSDFTVIGRGIPVHTGGLNNNFSYKQFDLNVFLQWSYGNDVVNANKLIFEGNGKETNELNQYATYKNRWTPEKTETTLYRTHGEGPAFYSSRLIEDGSFLRLKTLSLGYNLSKATAQYLKLRSARIYLTAQNLAIITNYSGPDPEVSTRNSTLTPGFDFSAYPRARTIVFGVNVSL